MNGQTLASLHNSFTGVELACALLKRQQNRAMCRMGSNSWWATGADFAALIDEQKSAWLDWASVGKEWHIHSQLQLKQDPFSFQTGLQDFLFFYVASGLQWHSAFINPLDLAVTMTPVLNIVWEDKLKAQMLKLHTFSSTPAPVSWVFLNWYNAGSPDLSSAEHTIS